MSLFNPTYNTTLTTSSLQALSLVQKSGIYNEIGIYYNQYVKPYYIDKYRGDYFAQLQLIEFDEEHGVMVETDLRNWVSGNTASGADPDFIKVLAEIALDVVLNARLAFTILKTNAALTAEMSDMQILINEQEEALLNGDYTNKRFQAPILCDVKASVNMDMRYLLYIKEHGPPVDGLFDPVKLAKYIYLDASGNPLEDQEYVQYTAFGRMNSILNEEQVLPTIFTEPVLGDSLFFEEVINL